MPGIGFSGVVDYANVSLGAATRLMGAEPSDVGSFGVSVLQTQLNLLFNGINNFDPRITFTRASSATFTNSAGLIASATTNTPRIDYDPVTLAAKGLLIEEARTNLLLRSEEFDNASWTKSAATVTANATTAPDGTLTADKLVEDIAAGVPHNAQQTTTNGNSAYVMSVYVKASERTLVFVGMSDGVTALSGAFFNLSTQVVTQSTGGSWTATNAFMQSVGNGWFRCVAIGTRGAGTTTIAQIYLATSTASVSYTGDGTSGLFIWGAQLEAGAFATSYIPTVASQVTRAADVAVMTGSNFSSWYNSAEGTFVVTGDIPSLGGPNFPSFLSVDDTTVNNAIEVSVWDGASDQFQFAGYVGGAAQWAVAGPSYVAGATASIAAAYKVNDFQAAYSGALGTADVSGTVPTVTQMRLGLNRGATSPLCGHIRRITYYATRLPNATLQALSA